MSIRDDLLAGLRAAEDTAIGDATPEQIVDAFRVEVLREAEPELSAEVDRLRAELAAERRLHRSTIDERDQAHDMADKLAYAVADEWLIGEHSSGNCPWVNALELITPVVEVDRLRTRVAKLTVLLERARRDASTALARTGGER